MPGPEMCGFLLRRMREFRVRGRQDLDTDPKKRGAEAPQSEATEAFP
jgi:hypothetical protein